MVAQTVGLGMVASFLFIELLGLSPGGLIVPGYLAFFWNQPFRLLATALVALVTYGLLTVLARFTVLYGRRRFMAAILTAYVIGWFLETVLLRLPPIGQDLRVIGFIIPGLIANDFVKQGIIKTFLAALAVSAAVRVVLLLATG